MTLADDIKEEDKDKDPVPEMTEEEYKESLETQADRADKEDWDEDER